MLRLDILNTKWSDNKNRNIDENYVEYLKKIFKEDGLSLAPDLSLQWVGDVTGSVGGNVWTGFSSGDYIVFEKVIDFYSTLPGSSPYYKIVKRPV